MTKTSCPSYYYSATLLMKCLTLFIEPPSKNNINIGLDQLYHLLLEGFADHKKEPWIHLFISDILQVTKFEKDDPNSNILYSNWLKLWLQTYFLLCKTEDAMKEKGGQQQQSNKKHVELIEPLKVWILEVIWITLNVKPIPSVWTNFSGVGILQVTIVSSSLSKKNIQTFPRIEWTPTSQENLTSSSSFQIVKSIFAHILNNNNGSTVSTNFFSMMGHFIYLLTQKLMDTSSPSTSYRTNQTILVLSLFSSFADLLNVNHTLLSFLPGVLSALFRKWSDMMKKDKVIRKTDLGILLPLMEAIGIWICYSLEDKEWNDKISEKIDLLRDIDSNTSQICSNTKILRDKTLFDKTQIKVVDLLSTYWFPSLEAYLFSSFFHVDLCDSPDDALSILWNLWRNINTNWLTRCTIIFFLPTVQWNLISPILYAFSLNSFDSKNDCRSLLDQCMQVFKMENIFHELEKYSQSDGFWVKENIHNDSLLLKRLSLIPGLLYMSAYSERSQDLNNITAQSSESFFTHYRGLCTWLIRNLKLNFHGDSSAAINDLNSLPLGDAKSLFSTRRDFFFSFSIQDIPFEQSLWVNVLDLIISFGYQLTEIEFKQFIFNDILTGFGGNKSETHNIVQYWMGRLLTIDSQYISWITNRSDLNMTSIAYEKKIAVLSDYLMEQTLRLIDRDEIPYHSTFSEERILINSKMEATDRSTEILKNSSSLKAELYESSELVETLSKATSNASGSNKVLTLGNELQLKSIFFLKGIQYLSLKLTTDFSFVLIKILFPILKFFSHENFLVREEALKTLQTLAVNWKEKATVSSFLQAHLSFIYHPLEMSLLTEQRLLDTATTISCLVDLLGLEAFNTLGARLSERIVIVLEDHQTDPQIVISYVHVLGQIVKSALSKYHSKENPKQIQNSGVKSKDQMYLDTFIEGYIYKKDLKRRAENLMERTQKLERESTEPLKESLTDQLDKESAQNELINDPISNPSSEEEIVSSFCLKTLHHFATDASPVVRQKASEIMANAIELFSSCTMVKGTSRSPILPIIHTIWPSIVSGMKYSANLESYLTNLELIKKLSIAGKDFMKDRLNDVFPAIIKPLSRLSIYITEKYLKKPISQNSLWNSRILVTKESFISNTASMRSSSFLLDNEEEIGMQISQSSSSSVSSSFDRFLNISNELKGISDSIYGNEMSMMTVSIFQLTQVVSEILDTLGVIFVSISSWQDQKWPKECWKALYPVLRFPIHLWREEIAEEWQLRTMFEETLKKLVDTCPDMYYCYIHTDLGTTLTPLSEFTWRQSLPTSSVSSSSASETSNQLDGPEIFQDELCRNNNNLHTLNFGSKANLAQPRGPNDDRPTKLFLHILENYLN